MASKAQRKATKMHRRRAAARGLVRLEVQAARRDADLIRALAETLRNKSEKAKVLRSNSGESSRPFRDQDRFRRVWFRSSRRGLRRRIRATASTAVARDQSVKFLLDTNVISEIRKRGRADASVARWVARTPVIEIGTSVVVLAEIRRGIELKRRADPEQAAALDRWFAQMRSGLGDRVLPIDESIAEVWARLNVPDPLPLIDGLLAATAKVYGLTLVTRNVADISRSGVSLLNPFSP